MDIVCIVRPLPISFAVGILLAFATTRMRLAASTLRAATPSGRTKLPPPAADPPVRPTAAPSQSGEPDRDSPPDLNLYHTSQNTSRMLKANLRRQLGAPTLRAQVPLPAAPPSER